VIKTLSDLKTNFKNNIICIQKIKRRKNKEHPRGGRVKKIKSTKEGEG
jgi:hypothetical protein